MTLILAPLRGVTIRAFRETFASEIAAAGFTEAITPFIPAVSGYDPLSDRELLPNLRGRAGRSALPPAPPLRHPLVGSRDPRDRNLPTLPTLPNHPNLLLTPQFIGKDPAALSACLKRIKSAGFTTADLNCGCPFPMIRNKGRGSGLLRTPDVLRRMLDVGCEVMGPDRFSIKTRLGIDRTDELLALMDIINRYPLRFLTLHARTARQMYEGECDWKAAEAVIHAAKIPLVLNGDLPFPPNLPNLPLMLGRSFIRSLGARDDSTELLSRYLASSVAELSGDRPVLGRLKELIAYWKELPHWRSRWPLIKICRTVDELKSVLL